MRLAAISLPVADGQVAENTASLRRHLAAIDGEVDLVVLPELWTTGFLRESWAGAAEKTVETLHLVADLAREKNLAVAGSIVARDSASGTLRNRMFVVGTAGDTLGFYDKAHLFRPFGEERDLTPGDALTVLGHGGFRFGLAVCYDLRFPEMFRNLRLAGADVFLVSAEWPRARAEALEVLARARAIENFCYLVLSNRRGTAADGTEFGGEAIIFGPDGTVLDRDGGEKSWAAADISRAELERNRGFLNVFGERSRGTDSISF